MKRLLYYIELALALLNAGCLDDYNMPEVVSTSPAYNQLSVDVNSEVTVTFSDSMDTMKTCGEFSLASPSGSVDGCFTWLNSDSVLVFQPAEPLERAAKYTIRITDAAEDRDGNDLRDEFISVFYTGGDNISPRIDHYMPAAGTTGNSADSTVSIWFTEAMDPDTVYEGISITPAVEGYYSWEEGNTRAVFTPLKGLSYGVTYTVSVKNSMRDAAGNRLAEEVSFSFTAGDDFTPPGLSVYQGITPRLDFYENLLNNGAEKNGNIVMDFTEVVQTGLIADAVSISPDAEFYVTCETVNTGGADFTRAVVYFTAGLESEETYTLRIGSSIADMQENRLEREYRYVFVTDGPGSIRPVVQAMGNITQSGITSWAAGEVRTIIIEADDDYYGGIAVVFSHPVDPLSLKITVDPVIGTNMAKVVNIEWPGSAQGGAFSQLNFGLYGIASGVTYKITISGGANGLRDTAANHMKDDFVQIIKFRN